MKHIFLVIMTAIISSFAVAQPIINRTLGTNTVNDPRLMASTNLYAPRYLDTTAANLQKGIDTCAALIFTYAENSFWFRACNPKRWIKVLKTGDVSNIFASNGLSKDGDTVELGGTLNQNTTITQGSNYLRLQSGYPYKQVEAAKETDQPDSTGSGYILREIKPAFSGTPAQGMQSWYEGVGFALQAPQRPNVVYTRGIGLTFGGGNQTAGVAAWGEAWESNYRPDPIGGTPQLYEYHKHFNTRQGKQIRAESWTINAETNDLQFYRTAASYTLYDSSHNAYYSIGRNITSKYSQFTLFSTATGPALGVLVDSTNKLVDILPSTTGIQLRMHTFNLVTLPGSFAVDANGFSSSAHNGEFRIVRANTQAILGLYGQTPPSGRRGYILTDEATGFMDIQTQSGYAQRFLAGNVERMRINYGGGVMIGATPTATNIYQRQLFVGGSVGFQKDSLPTSNTPTSTFLVTTDTASGSNAGRLNKTQFAVSTYTPTLTNGANVDATAVPGTTWYYERFGNRVHVWGMLEVDPTAAATPTIVSFSLPFASALTQYYQLGGRGTGDASAGTYYGGFIQGDATNDRAQFDFTSGATINAVWNIDFWYEIL